MSSRGLSDWAQGVTDAAKWLTAQGHVELAKKMLAGSLTYPDEGTEDRVVAQIAQWIREQGFGGTAEERATCAKIATGVQKRDWSLR